MRGAVIHGVLLAVMLIYGYRTWTRDKTVHPDLGKIVLWNEPTGNLVSVEYKAKNRIVKLERKGTGAGAYWWGTDTTLVTRPKPVPPKPAAPKAGSGSAAKAGSGSAKAGSGSAKPATAGSAAKAGSGSGSAKPAASKTKPAKKKVEEEVVSRTTRQFPVGKNAHDLIKRWSHARALRDLGKPTKKQNKNYKLDDTNITITVTFKDGTHTLRLGGSVYGGADKYAVDAKTGKAYVLSRNLVSSLEIGESSLRLLDPRGFNAGKIESVDIAANGKTRSAVRVTSKNTSGDKIKTLGDATTEKPNTALANFINSANNLRPSEYDATLKPSDMTKLLELTYKDAHHAVLGTLTLYRYEKPGTLRPGQVLDPANPPRSIAEYYIMTEKTHVPALVNRSLALRVANNIAAALNENESESKPKAGSAAGSAHPPGHLFGAPHTGAPSPLGAHPIPAHPMPAHPMPAHPMPAHPMPAHPMPARPGHPAHSAPAAARKVKPVAAHAVKKVSATAHAGTMKPHAAAKPAAAAPSH